MADALADLPGGDLKIGGRSIYLYGALIGGVAVVYMWVTRRSQDQTAANSVATDVVPDVSGDLGDLPAAALPVTDADIDSESNRDWEVKSIAYLTLQGISPVAAQRALELYMEGSTIDYTQTGYVNRAIQQYGPPPEGLGGVPTTTDAPAAAAPYVPVAATAVKWTSTGFTGTAVGTVYSHTSPDAAAPVNGTFKAGTKIVLHETANVSGTLWGRSSAGKYINTRELRKV